MGGREEKTGSCEPAAETQGVKPCRIKIAKDAEKTLLKITQSLPAIGQKIREKIDALKTNPRLGSRLKGSDRETRRVRVGDYRIVYEVHEDYLLLLVVYIGPRGGAYRD